MILIVEDELLLRMDLEMLIEDGGLTWVSSSNADEALKILHQRDDVMLLITDINMPGTIDGLALCGLVADLWPQIGMIITSSNPASQRGQLPVEIPFYRKPYQRDSILLKIREILARQTGSAASIA